MVSGVAGVMPYFLNAPGIPAQQLGGEVCAGGVFQHQIGRWGVLGRCFQHPQDGVLVVPQTILEKRAVQVVNAVGVVEVIAADS